jgi:hypothetical protein
MPRSPGCSDQYSSCFLWMGRCNSEWFGHFVRAQCRSTCNACVTECSDAHAACEVWKDQGHCKLPGLLEFWKDWSFVNFVRTYCQKSCGVCTVQRHPCYET